MPGGDKTGPFGIGPMSGRAAGYCTGFPVPGFSNPVGRFWRMRAGYGAGFGFGRGMGMGFRHRYFATGLPFLADVYGDFGSNVAYPSEENLRKYEERALLQEAQILKEQLKEIQSRLEELKSKKESSNKEEKQD